MPAAAPSRRHHQSAPQNGLVYATLLLLFWLPLPMGSNRDWAAALFVSCAALLCGVWAWRYPHGPLSSTVRTALPMLGALVLTQCWVAAQWLFGISADSGQTFNYLMLGIGYCLLFLLIVGLFNTRRRITLLLATLVASGTFQAFFGSFMTLSGLEWLLFSPKEHYLGVVTGTFVNRNHLAGYLEMTIALGIGLMLALRTGEPFRWRHLAEWLLSPKAVIRIALVIMVIALVMSRSRMGNTAFFGSLAVIGAVFVLLNREHRLRNSLIIASLIVIDVLVISQYFGLEKLKDRLLETRLHDQVIDGEVVQHANEQRGDVFADGLRQFAERPVQGYGAGSFESTFQQFAGPEITLHYDHAHNDFLQFAIEFGLIGLLPLALFVLFALYQSFKALWRTESWYRSGLGFGCAMGILALLIHSLTDFNLQIPANAATFVTLCALASLANSHRSGRHRA